jgi:excisionase family DNA binding protein
VEKRLQRGGVPENPEDFRTIGVMAMASGMQVQVAVREVMDIRQASDYLGISGDTLYRYASEGFVPAFKLGNRWRFRKSLLDGWMDEKSGVNAAPVDVDPTLKKGVGRAR